MAKSITNERRPGFVLTKGSGEIAKDNHIAFGLTPTGDIVIEINKEVCICTPEQARYVALTIIELAHDIEAGHVEVPNIAPEPKGQH